MATARPSNMEASHVMSNSDTAPKLTQAEIEHLSSFLNLLAALQPCPLLPYILIDDKKPKGMTHTITTLRKICGQQDAEPMDTEAPEHEPEPTEDLPPLDE